MQIKITKDYDQFKTILGNRKVDMNHVNTLIKMNSKENLLWQFPGAVTKDGYIYDGQHRLAAAKANNWDFYYTQSDKTLAELGDTIVATTNIAQKSWPVYQFINFHAAHKKEQYLFLQELIKNNKLSHPIILQLIMGKNSSIDIKSGNLKLYTNLDEREAILELISQYVSLKGTISSLVLIDSRFASAMRTVFKDFSAEDLILQLDRTPIKITQQRGVKDYLRLIEDVINWKKHEKNFH